MVTVFVPSLWVVVNFVSPQTVSAIVLDPHSVVGAQLIVKFVPCSVAIWL
jgi:hypothetical protein